MAKDPNRDLFLQTVEARADIGGRYLRPLRVGAAGGDGHFSLVFKATDVQTGREVAIKVFRPDRLNEPYRFQCFCREATLLERLAGTPAVLGWVGARDEFVEQAQTTTGISFEYQFQYFAVELASTDVGSILREGSWRAGQKLVAFREMCKAVQRIHRQGVVHRDIKPSNFLVMGNGGVKLSDFGTARGVEGDEPPILGTYLATPGDSRYASPEMHALLHDDDPSIALKGDIFSLAATLFEMFSGAVLGIQIFDPGFAADLTQAMGAVDRRDRRRVYLEFLQALDAGHPLPSISAYGNDVPPAIRALLDGLYKSMATLDFRRRLCDFETIFLKIDQCLLVLRFQEKVKQWRQRKEIYKQNRLLRQAQRQEAVTIARRRELR